MWEILIRSFIGIRQTARTAVDFNAGLVVDIFISTSNEEKENKPNMLFCYLFKQFVCIHTIIINIIQCYLNIRESYKMKSKREAIIQKFTRLESGIMEFWGNSSCFPILDFSSLFIRLGLFFDFTVIVFVKQLSMSVSSSPGEILMMKGRLLWFFVTDSKRILKMHSPYTIIILFNLDYHCQTQWICI